LKIIFKNYGVLLRARKFSPEMYRDRRFGLHQNLVFVNSILLEKGRCKMKWMDGYRIKLMLCGVVAVIVLSAANAWGASFVDDFNRPDGEVGNGWEIQTYGTIEVKIIDSEVFIEGQQPDWWWRSGINRFVDGETIFSFDFKADNQFNVHIQLYDAEDSLISIDVYASPGGSFSYGTLHGPGTWSGWTKIPGSEMIAGQYNTLMVEQEGTVFTLTLNDQVVGTFTNSYFTRVGKVLVGSDATPGSSGSLHIDNFKMETAEEADNPNPDDDASGENTKLTNFTFGEPVNLGPTVNSSGVECFATISSDGLELYLFDLDFLRPGGCGGWDIWVTRRPSVSEPWSEPINLGPPINTEYDDAKPSISADGLTLYFSSNRPGGYGAFDIWVSTRATVTDDWSAPVNLGEPVNSEFDEIFPCISSDGLELYFNEWFGALRPGGYGESDIWVAKRTTKDEPWGEPVNLGEAVNSSYYDSCAYLSSDGLLLFLHGWQPGGPGPEDIWVATRSSTSDAWSARVPLPVPINCRYTDGTAGISADGLMFYFASLRGGGSGTTDVWKAPIMPIADFNGDGRVDDGDVDILNSYMGTNESLCDIGPMPWGDGIVDEADLEVLNSYMGQEVSYPYDPRQASTPMPLDQGVSDEEQAPFLSWWPGSSASEHDVYVGTNSAAVEDADTSDTTGVYRGRQEASEYILPENIESGQVFFWRVDEVTADGMITKGEIWNFSIVDYIFIDDMEFRGEQMWFIWWDGWGDPNNGAAVYYPETNVVHGGEQSMYLVYDNSTAPISQVLRAWETPQDWARNGTETLSLWIHGHPDNTPDSLQVILGDSADNVAMVMHPDPSVLLSDSWHQWSIPLADFTGLNLSEIASMTIVIGDDSTEEGGTGTLFIDDVCLH
jgi:hypothetical protein